MKTKLTYIATLTVLVIIIFNGCKHHPKEVIQPGPRGHDTTVIIPTPTTNCSPDTVYFQNTILPILVANCNGTGCHNATDRAEDIVLDSYSGAMKIVKAGNPTNSKLYQYINSNSKPMPPPPSKKLDAATIDLIKRWILQGAKNNYCNSGCDSTKFAYAADISKIVSTNCGGTSNSCHFSGTAATKIGTYQDLKNTGINGKLWNSINHIGNNPMPSPSLKLSSCDIKKIQKWINTGYPQ